MATTIIPKNLRGDISSNWANALGGAIGSLGSGMAQGMGQPYQTQVSPFPYQLQMGKQNYRQTIKFNRVNEVVEMLECDILLEPLDELRIKVVEWLYN